ncbi:hypothetical protein H7F15_08300 [Pontibacter sp. Tf4]|uniref:hypothetical protein n=1 Tax=Pontibacter sp. Tf4 TaxID=2761620 RepID=UPI0016278818|nr:hypothetical protein [Pontibacter sp. Tf4]MBB6611034.1 hypothetical protein [Pontibacter sp. Tf4]
MKYLTSLLFVFLLLTSCKSDDPEKAIVDTKIEMSVKDASGADMLDPTNANGYNAEEIEIFYVVDGVKQKVNNTDMDHPKGFHIFKQGDTYRIRIFPNADFHSSFPVTIVKWNETNSDTIKCNIERTDNSQICKQVWVNDELAWEGYETERFIELVK